MNSRNLALFFCVLVACATAGQAVSFTAFSDKSQQDADNKAILGAFRIHGFNTHIIERINQANAITIPSGVFLKEIKTKKGYKAQVILDLDSYLSNLQTRIDDLYREINTLKGTAEQFINNRLYISATKDLELAQKKKDLLKKYIALYASFIPLNKTFRFDLNLAELEKKLLERISGISLESSNSSGALSLPEISTLRIRITDSFGPLPNFPIIARQDSHFIENRTLANGEASFTFQNLNFDDGPHEIVIEPNLTPMFSKKINDKQKLKIYYNVNRNSETEPLLCAQKNINCNALWELYTRQNFEKSKQVPSEIDVSNLISPSNQSKSINNVSSQKESSN